MKYLTLFDTQTEYETYINGGGIALPNVSLIEESMSLGYKPWVYDPSKEYFTMVVTVGGDIKWKGTSKNTMTTSINNKLSYSTDGGATWSTASSNIALSVNEGDKVLWKGITTPIQYEGIGKFSGSTDVRYAIEGNVMSLLFGDDFKGQTSLEGKNSAFYGLFENNTSITNAENLSLPATTLAKYCYGAMFSGTNVLPDCSNIDFTSETVVASGGLMGLFSGTKITDNELKNILPINHNTNRYYLPVTTLASSCYMSMFARCTSLTTAPELPATTLANSCYGHMFEDCTSLTTAPELPATTLADWCYSRMFEGCTSLSSIKCLATDISAGSCTDYWVNNVASSGTFTKAASMSGWTTGTSGIPSGWNVVDAA